MPEDQPHNHNPASNPEFESLGEEQKQEWLRRKALTEILYTEQLYVQDLITLQQLFLEKSKDVLPAGYRREIFHSLEAVVGVAKMFLQELQSLPVHVAFMKVANFLKVYTAYCAGYNNSLLALTQSRKSSKEWDKYLKETENTQQTNFLSLSSYLIKPVQRICRYPLMLREIMKYTPQSHTDYGSFGEALAQIERITEQVNEGKRVSENMQRIVEIHNSFSDREKPDICNPSRILVREGALMKLSDGKLQTRHFFLFNDSLLYAKPTLLKKSEGLWVFCGQWSLDKIQILDISSPGSSAPPVASLRGSGELTRSPEIMRGSGGSEIIRSDRVLQRKAAEIFGGSVGMARTTDDTPSSSPSLYLSSPSSTASSTPSIVSSPSPPLSPNSPTFGSGQRGNLMINQRAAIPSIFLTPPPSPTFAPASAQRKHSNTESDASTHKAESAGLRIVIAAKRRSRELSDTEKDKEKSKEATGPGGSSSVRIDHKRSLTASAGDDKIPHEVSTRSATPPLDSEANKNSINLARTHSVEYQKLVASLPDNAQHCFIVYAPVMGKPKRYILCAPDQRTKMLWLNDLLTQWRKASMLSQSRAIRLVSQELGDQLESSMEMKVEVRSKEKEKEKEEKNVGREQKSKEERREEKEVMELLEVKIAAPKEVSNDGRSNETRRERQKEIKGGTGGTEASSEAKKEREKELKGSTGIREATSELWREREKQQLKVSLEMIKEASISEMRRERDKEMKGSGGVTKEASISEVRRERDKEMKGSGGISKEASKTNEMEKSKVKQELQGKEVEIGRLDTRSRMENVPRPKRETGGDKKELEVRMEDLLVDKKIVEVVSRVYREIEESEFERAIRERLDKVNNEDRSPLPSDRSERELGRGGGGGGAGGAAGGAGGGGGKSDRREKLEGSTGTPRGDQSDKNRGGREKDKERDRERDKERNGENRGERTDRERKIEKERSDVRRGDNNERPEQRKEVEKRGRSNSSESAKTDRSDRSDRSNRSEARRQLGKDSDRSDRSGYKSDVSERSDRGERSDSERERSDRETSTERARAREKRDKERREARERRENKERREKQHVMYRDNSNSSEMRGGERGREKKEAKERHRDGELRDLTCEEENEELWAHIKFLEVCLRGEKEKGGKEKKERKEKGKEKGEGKDKETRKETEEKYGDEETNNTAGIEREKDTRLQNTAGKPKRSHSPAAKRG